MANKRPLTQEEGEEIALELGVRFCGIWKELNQYLFNDDVVGAFTADSPEQARAKFEASKGRFNATS